MPKYIHPATPEIAYKVASLLTDDDYREVAEGHGLDPKIWMPIWTACSDASYFIDQQGELAGMVGVEKGGAIWMLCTNAIYHNRSLFVRQGKKYIESRPEKFLYNIVDNFS